ncbi:MAG: flagellin lysine-N-methylase [Ruminococcus sp.]|nr:flagellin lysine-N-methylase [Ruminococcus sp.]
MQHIYPDYYHKFKCIADRCLHNCCIGWEIDIDSTTANFYKSLKGDLGKRLQENVNFDAQQPYFILKENERCPFLDSNNLCDIITNLGEERLCTICSEHPRFHNELPRRVESGLGMCCEEAARIILSKKDTTTLIYEKEASADDEIIILRDKVLEILQDRSFKINQRLDKMLLLCEAFLPCLSASQWAEEFLYLERLDEKWTDALLLLKSKGDTADAKAFDIYMKNRQEEYEQLAVYFTYRHFANAPDLEEASIRAKFTALSLKLIHTLGALIYSEKGEFTLEDQIELCRMYSSEIEYSDENLYSLFDKLA